VLFGELEQRERVLAFARCSHSLTPRSTDCSALERLDLDNLLVSVTHSVWRSVEGDTKAQHLEDQCHTDCLTGIHTICLTAGVHLKACQRIYLTLSP
jgi:hypothetical protein